MTSAKVLLVDDNALARKISSNFIKKIVPEMELLDFSNAKELYALLEETKETEKNTEELQYIIFTDFNMPEIDGLALTSWIKRHPRFHNIPVIIMTAEDNDQEKDRFFKMGVDAFCLKPLKEDEIKEALEKTHKKFMSLSGLSIEELEQGFLDESIELMDRFLEILNLEQPKKLDHYKEIYRILHTIKGVSGAVNYPVLSLFIHDVETLVQKIIDFKLFNHEKGIELLKLIAQSMMNVFAQIKEKKLTLDLINTFQQPIQSLVLEMASHSYHGSTPETTSSLISGIVEDVSILKKSDTIRVKHEQLDYLQSKLKRLMQIKVQMSTFANQLGQEFHDEHFPKQLQEFILKLENASIEALEGLIKLRARPVTVLKPFCEKMVHGISTTLKKEIKLEFQSVEFLEVDQPIIDLLQGALGHLLKNSIDHGIETPAERIKSGKTKYGTIEMILRKMDHKNFLVQIKDNGKGIQTDKLKSHIIAKGLMDEKFLEKMTTAQINSMVFLDGLSTKTENEVSEISGRGVGMSAVKQSIEDMGGSINVQSDLNIGTTFEIRLPLFFVL